MSDRPRVGVSACLLGEPVRYDAGHKRDSWLVSELGPRVEWVPVCPEVEAGFGTPRETMQLVREHGERGGTVALVTTGTGRDVTDKLLRYTGPRVEELAGANLDGYVLKADSPSCGPGPGDADEVRGLFADALMARLPDLPVVDERQLADPTRRDAFVERVFEHHRRARLASRPAEDKAQRPAGAFRQVEVVRVRGGERTPHDDRAATEEPLEIRLHDRPFAVIMRTPGADRELAAGFLLAERVIAGADDLGTIRHCADGENIVNVTLADPASGALDRLLADRRQVTTHSSCGLCGRRTIESLAADVEPIRSGWTVTATIVSSLPGRVRARQAVFDETGGLHAAGLFAADGTLVEVAEDVGRHNAVDKIVGRVLMRDALPLSDHLLCVSGRTSFEIVQKAIFAGIPIVAAVSAPSSLAIELAEEYGVTLIGFVRDDGFNIYAHPQRVEG